MMNAPQPPLQVEWKLILDDGSNAVKIVPITGDELLVGRAVTADIHLDDLRISRHHARLTRKGDQLIVEDLQTVNGTSVNGQPITQPYALQANDIISLGPLTLRVEQTFVSVPQTHDIIDPNPFIPDDEPAFAPVPETVDTFDPDSFLPDDEPDFIPVPQTQPMFSPDPFILADEPAFVPVPQPAYQAARAVTPAAPFIPKLALFLLAGLAGLIFLSLIGCGLYWLVAGSPFGQEAASADAVGPIVTITQAPAHNSTVALNQPVTIQALAEDPTGVTRLELWVNERKVDEVDTQLVEVAPTLNAALQWQPDAPGSYTLKIRAYNEANLASTRSIASLIVVNQLDTPTPNSTVEPPPVAGPTVTPVLPTATQPLTTPDPSVSTAPPADAGTASDQALLLLNVPALNVRAGPGTDYSQVGQLTQGTPAEIVGQADAGQGTWWEIRFVAGPGGTGWVTADPTFVKIITTTASVVPVVEIPTPDRLPSPTPTASVELTPTATVIAAEPTSTVIRAPAGKTLLILSNRSMSNQPALLTLSDGVSADGGRAVDVQTGNEVQLILEPDFYRATWTSPARPGGFARGEDFTAVKDTVIVMWIVPEEGRADTEVYDELIASTATPTPRPTPAGTPTPGPIQGNYPSAPSGKALFVAANRTLDNSYVVLTLSGGSLAGGQEIKLDAGVETTVELLPGNYRAVWSSPTFQGSFTAGRAFDASAGEVILSWVIPDQGQVFMQFPGQEAEQINN
jgi:hypothetical protein